MGKLKNNSTGSQQAADTKSRIRKKLLEKLKSEWDKNNKVGFARLSPGTGKSYMIINIIREHIDYSEANHITPNILVLVSSRTLRDKTFVEEVEKWWNKNDFSKYVTITCYQSQMNVSGNSYSLGIADEGDVMLSPKFLEGYTNNIFAEFLCLSGTFNTEKMKTANSLFGDILLDYPTKQAQEEGLLNKTIVELYPVPLLKVNDIPTKKGKWSEAAQMKWIDGKIDKLRGKSFALWNAINEEKDADKKKELRKEHSKVLNSKKFLESGNGKSSRLNILYNLKSTQLASKTLLDELLINENNKILVFSERTSIVDNLCGENTFYGNKPPSILSKFDNGDIRYLGVSKKVERGFNFIGLNHSIFQSFNGSESNFQQKLGRLLRLESDEVATLHIIVSYYTDNGEIVPCRNHQWFKSIVEAFGIDYNVNKKFM